MLKQKLFIRRFKFTQFFLHASNTRFRIATFTLLVVVTAFTRGEAAREGRMRLFAATPQIKSGIASAIEVNFMAFGSH